MSKTKTIYDIYAAINPLPAKLTEKGKVNPSVEFEMEANAGFRVMMNWKKYGAVSEWEKEYHSFSSDSFDQCVSKAEAFIAELPTAEQARLHAFMDKLGKLIDVGKSEGIAVEDMNPLLATMKRLSKNIITHKPSRKASELHPDR